MTMVAECLGRGILSVLGACWNRARRHHRSVCLVVHLSLSRLLHIVFLSVFLEFENGSWEMEIVLQCWDLHFAAFVGSLFGVVPLLSSNPNWIGACGLVEVFSTLDRGLISCVDLR